mmetsp:Transcript_68780/g.107640  ORF Transcript_68780/g.107640 Transcript_68780/m.107640 type:complete len:231 (-) Transcript_68780:64-756(-)
MGVGSSSTNASTNTAQDDPHDAELVSTRRRWAWNTRSRASRGATYAQDRQEIAQLQGPPRRRRRRAETPSTATPGSASASLSSFGTPDAENIDDEGEFYPGSSAEQKLDIARKRAKESMEALRMNLQGFGGAVAVRYASWPPGAAVRIITAHTYDGGDGDSSVYGRLVSHDSAQGTFEVKLRDGSVRIVPEKSVQRVTQLRTVSQSRVQNREGTSPSMFPASQRSPPLLS